MEVLNTTIQNRSKRDRLTIERIFPTHYVDSPGVARFLLSLDSVNAPKEQILYSIGATLLEGNDNPAVRSVLREYERPLVLVGDVPRDAFDLLGSVYQYLNTKAESLIKGAFYTGRDIALELVGDLAFDGGQILLDPACGSGSLLFRSAASADQIVGVDVDPVAIMLAKFNYFIKFPAAGPPALYCDDFFKWYAANQGRRFDYIVSNPPYGANLDLGLIRSDHVTSGESFSYFIEYGYRLLSAHGKLRFLVPDALLNVKRHTDIRRFMLDQANLSLIKRYTEKFAGVMSDVYLLELDTDQNQTHTRFIAGREVRVPKSLYRRLKNSIYVHWDDLDVAIVEKAEVLGAFDLSDSTFALGVVTGDNKTKLLSQPCMGSEPIYTGKEVERYALLSAQKHIVFDRTNLQQVAPDEIYRAPEKLVYKVISKHLRFALDVTGSLTTNSANLVIPSIPGYSTASVLALLNSKLYSFLYVKLFGGVNKIGKEHLMALPFPRISPAQDAELVQLVHRVLVTPGDDGELENYVHESLFDLSAHEVAHVRGVIR
jgi:hypothetical protein